MGQRQPLRAHLDVAEQQKIEVEHQPAGTEPPPPASSGAVEQVTVVQSPPQTIIIQPAQPDVVYVPQYNPTAVYGAPVPPASTSPALMVASTVPPPPGRTGIAEMSCPSE